MKKREAKNDLANNDKLIVYHVTNPDKYQDMAQNFHPDTIISSFETEAIRCDINFGFDIKYVVEEKKDKDDKIRNKIRDYADANADVIVLGAFGAKRTIRESADNAICIGNTTALVTSGCKAVAIVVGLNALGMPPQKQRRFLVAVDGSDMSHCAVMETIKYMKNGDYIQIIYVETDSNKKGKPIIEKYDQLLVESKVKGVCKCIKKQKDVSISDEILDVAETGDEMSEYGGVHLIVMGSNGLSHSLPPSNSDVYDEYKKNQRHAHMKGSVATEILNNAKSCSVMTITVDALMSGSVKSLDFHSWFDGK